MAKILVVDDSETQRVQLKKDLEGAGHQVVEATNGHDGLEKLNSQTGFDLIISDINMPGMDGLTMCSKIHAEGKHTNIPIFMLTSEASQEQKQSAKQYGVRAWITKPFAADKLIAAIAKVAK